MIGLVCAIVTTFRPSMEIFANLAQIAKQADLVIVVDDTGEGESIKKKFAENIKYLYLKNSQNIGIAASLNIGVRKAIDLGFEYFLTVDDDTWLADDYLSYIKNAFETLPLENIGLISCSRGTTLSSAIDNDFTFSEKRTLITSGSFFSKNVFLKVGGFEETFFIDLVDFDFAMKVKKNGFKVILLNKIGMVHKVGNSVGLKYLAFRYTVFHHAPFRLYYQIRNSIFFFKTYYTQDFPLCLYILLDLIRIPIKTILFENNKILRLKYILLGYFDALRGYSGKSSVKFG